MAKVQSRPSKRKILFIVLLFALFMGAVAFKAGVVDISSLKRASFGPELSDVISLSGPVKARDLNLSTGEIRQINRALLKHRTVFPHVRLVLDVKGQSRPVTVDPGTMLDMAMVLEVDSECQVRSWNRTVARRDLAGQMVRYMDKCAEEYDHYKDAPGMKNIRYLYI